MSAESASSASKLREPEPADRKVSAAFLRLAAALAAPLSATVAPKPSSVSPARAEPVPDERVFPATAALARFVRPDAEDRSPP